MIHYMTSSKWFRDNDIKDGGIAIIIYEHSTIIYKVENDGLLYRINENDVNEWLDKNHLSLPFENKEDEMLFILTFG